MQNNTKDYYDEAYRLHITPWTHADIGDEGYKFIQLCQTEMPNRRILDLGCGNGKFAILFAQNGFESYGIDFAPEAITQAKRQAGALGLLRQLHFHTGDVLNLPYSQNFFDAAADFGCLHHIKKCYWLEYLRNLANVLKKNGYFFLTVFSKNTSAHFTFCPLSAKRSWNIHNEPIGIGHYDYFFRKKEIENLFERQFKILNIIEKESGPTRQKVFQALMKKL